MLSGERLREWDVPTRLWNMVMPFPINLDQSPGRQLLFDSNYDLRTSVMHVEGVNLTDSPQVRSMFQYEMGQENLERDLNRLARDPRTAESMAQMERDLADGKRHINPMSYWHNRQIKRLFEDAKKAAWARESVKLQKHKHLSRKKENGNYPQFELE